MTASAPLYYALRALRGTTGHVTERSRLHTHTRTCVAANPKQHMVETTRGRA